MALVNGAAAQRGFAGRRWYLIPVASGICVSLHAVGLYPAEFLWRPDRDVWIAQIAVWIWILLQGSAVAAIFALVLAGGRRFVLARSEERFPFNQAGLAFDRWLRRPVTPWILGTATALIVVFEFGSLHPPVRFPDDAAYQFQAQLFSRFRWTAAPAPMPEFFQQLYLWGTDQLRASKYPPGFSLFLIPGIWLHLPGLMPALALGAAGALMFILAREGAGPWVALWAWALWSTEPQPLSVAPLFSSEHLSLLLGLAGFWVLSRWTRSRRRGVLSLAALLFGIAAITRPLTAILYAVVAVILVLRRIRSAADLPRIALAGLAGLLPLLLIPLWSQKTTGDWRVSPLALYGKTYTPYETLSIHPTKVEPLRRLPEDLDRDIRGQARLSRTQDIRNFPRILGKRLVLLFHDIFPGWRIVLAPALLVGLLCLPRAAYPAAGFVALLLLVYLLHPQPDWLLTYYLEIHPIVDFTAALGLAAFIASVSDSERKAAGLALLVSSILILPVVLDIVHARRKNDAFDAPQREFRRLVKQSTADPSLVFIKLPAEGIPPPLVCNPPDLDQARTWAVRDLGDEPDRRLMSLQKERHTYLYDTITRSLRTWTPGEPR
jgi:hypothetical protein